MRSMSGFCRNVSGSTGGKSGLMNPMVGSFIAPGRNIRPISVAGSG
jgi:hypothetical protein